MNFKVLDIEMLKNDNLGFTISGKMETYLRVENVNPVGLAFKAGLKQDDYIIMINGIKIKGREDIMHSVNECRDTLNIKVIRYNESKDRCSVSKKILTLNKRRSGDFQSLHHSLLSTLGSKVGMEITRSYDPSKKPQEIKNPKLSRRRSTNSESVQREISVETKVAINISQYHAPIKKHVDLKDIKPVRRRSSDLQHLHKNREAKVIKEKTSSYGKIKIAYETGQQRASMDFTSRQFSHDNFNIKPSKCDSDTLFAVPSNKYVSNLIENTDKHEFSTRNLSLRKKKPEKNNSYLLHKSLTNINIVDKTIANSPFIRDTTNIRKFSSINIGSMASLFEEDHSTSIMAEYVIDWKAIFLKISEKTSHEIEFSLKNYFHSNNTNLTLYPYKCLYRYLTYDDVLCSIFNNILSSDFHVDFQEEILKTPTVMSHNDYDINTSNIIKLIECNIKRVQKLIVEYEERKKNFQFNLNTWKDSLDQYLKNPDYSFKMLSLIDSICTKLEMMNNTVILAGQLLSRWKLSKEFPYLFVNIPKESAMLNNCEITFVDFKQSQKKLELQMSNLIKLFRDDKPDEVMRLIGNIFSENIELHLFLPIFIDKLNNDNKILAFLETTPLMESGPEQFV